MPGWTLPFVVLAVFGVAAWWAVRIPRAVPRPAIEHAPPRPYEQLVGILKHEAWYNTLIRNTAIAWMKPYPGGVWDVIVVLDIYPGGAYAYRCTCTQDERPVAPQRMLWYLWDSDAAWIIERMLGLPRPCDPAAPSLDLLPPPVHQEFLTRMELATRVVWRPPQAS